MPFISSSYDGSSRRSSGSSDFSGLRGLDRFSSSRKSSVYERPSTYTSSSSSATAPSTTVSSPVPNYRSLERIKNGTSGSSSSTSGVGNYDNGSNSTSGKSSTSSYLSSTTPSRFSRNSDSTSGYSSSRHENTSSPFGLPRRDSSTSSYLRSESNNGNDYPTSTTSYGGGNSNNSTLERSSYTKPASRSNSSNLFNLENNNDNNNLNEPTPTTTSSRFSSSYSESGTTTPAPTTTSTTGFSRKNSMVDLNGIADMTKRINETLARHGLDEKKTYPSYEAPTPKQPSYNGRLSDNRYHHSTRESRDREIVATTATPTGSWRRRHDSNNTNNAPVLSSTPSSPPAMIKAVEPPKWDISDQTTVTAMKTVISRCTSPASKDSDKALRTRIARTTDPIVVEHRRSRKPRVVDNYCQTDVTPEYGTLADHLKPPPPPPEPVVLKDKSPEVTRVASFDYFARMQSMMDSNNGTKFAPKEPESEEEEEDYYKVKRAPMMMLLPGTRNSQVESPAPISPNKKLSDALSTNSNNIETEEESEYTYETEEEEEEEDGVQENGILPPDDLESYEIKAERVLEEQRERVSIAPELDYIDEEDEDVQPQVTSPKRKKKGPFISGTIDIDDLLAKEQTPTNFALDDNSITSPAPPCTQEPKKHVEFSETVSSKEVPQDDSWWPETNGHDIGSQLVSRFEPVEDTQDDEQKDIEVGVEENGVEEWEEEE